MTAQVARGPVQLTWAIDWRLIEAYRPIEGTVLLYFPESPEGSKNWHAEMYDIGNPASYPHRPPTHFAVLSRPSDAPEPRALRKSRRRA